jgi:hypothetical protein
LAALDGTLLEGRQVHCTLQIPKPPEPEPIPATPASPQSDRYDYSPMARSPSRGESLRSHSYRDDFPQSRYPPTGRSQSYPYEYDRREYW